jgi:hypothetical protein
MECPKCGAAQGAGRDECSACGIVFSRWQPRQVRRPTLSSSTPVQPPASSGGGIPMPFILVGIVFVVIFGLMWTKHVREQRAKFNPDDMLNEINNKGSNLRRQLREEQAAIARAQNRASMTAAAVTPKLPSDIDEERLKNMFEECNYFRDSVVVDIPKKFQPNIYRLILDRYPATSMAAVEHLIEFDPPFNAGEAARHLPNPAYPGDMITVKLTPYAYQKVDVREDDDVYHFGLGRRKVEITRTTLISESKISAEFTWTLEQSAGANLSPEGEGRSGAAEFQRTAGGWSMVRAFRNTHNSYTNICP